MPYHQSAPVKVPVRPPPPRRRGWDHLAGVPSDGYDDDDEEELLRGDAAMLPPHEMVARASAGGFGAPVKPSSMLEGVGRTLKGRDLRRVRDAVLRQTGFLD
uniref:Senescence regulator n=1 Tax=Oryza brachyantha TaxID=4533 RepID=J3N2L8_ORYBR